MQRLHGKAQVRVDDGAVLDAGIRVSRVHDELLGVVDDRDDGEALPRPELAAPAARDVEGAARGWPAVRLARRRRLGRVHRVRARRDDNAGFIGVDPELPGARCVGGGADSRERAERPFRGCECGERLRKDRR